MSEDCWLVVWNITSISLEIKNVIIPTDERFFSEGLIENTNQILTRWTDETPAPSTLTVLNATNLALRGQ